MKNNKFFKSVVAVLLAMLMVSTLLVPAAVAASPNEVAVVAEETQDVNPIVTFIQTIRNMFQSFIEFIRNLFVGTPKPVEPEASAALLKEIVNAEEGAVIDGKGVTVLAENTIILSKNITLQNMTITAADKNNYAVSIAPGTSVTLENVNIEGRFWVSGNNIKLNGCSFNKNMNIDGVDGLVMENCVLATSNPITFGSTVANVTIKNNTVLVSNAQVRIHENVTSISKVYIVNNGLPLRISADLGAAQVYANAVATANFVYIK